MVEENIMKKAIIDLGTNTFNLMIGEVVGNQFCKIYSTKTPVLLGMDGINHGVIAHDAMERAKQTLCDFKTICQVEGVDDIIGIGTSALREASNSSELIDFSKKELNIELEVISGVKEARLIYNGVSWLHDFEEESLVMDIGGGSTEFIHADKTGVIAEASLNIGVSRIYQMLEKPADFSKSHMQLIDDFLNKHKSHFFADINSPVLIGSSGSFETIYKLIHQEKFPKENRLISINIKEVKEVLDWLEYSTLEERMDNKWISQMRKPMMPITAAQMKWAINELEIEEFLVSPYSLKEGAFVE